MIVTERIPRVWLETRGGSIGHLDDDVCDCYHGLRLSGSAR